MNNLFLTLLALIYSTLGLSAAPVLKDGQKVPEISTSDGKTYKNVTVKKIEPHGLNIIHDDGSLTIPAEVLPQYRSLFASDEEIKRIRELLKKQKVAREIALEKDANQNKDLGESKPLAEEKFSKVIQNLKYQQEMEKQRQQNIDAERKVRDAKLAEENVINNQTLISRYGNARREAESASNANRSDFKAGFKNGYKKGNPYGFTPLLAPWPEFGRDSYEDGFGVGYAKGLEDSSSRSNQKQ